MDNWAKGNTVPMYNYKDLVVEGFQKFMLSAVHYFNHICLHILKFEGEPE